MRTRELSSPVVRGGLLALLAAALFGLSTPLVQRFGQGLGPFTTAALLYGGAALVAVFQRRGASREEPLSRSDAPRLLATVAWGVDNTLSRGVAERDPGQVVLAKAALGALATTAVALLRGEPLPTQGAALALLAVGASGYGLSLRFYLLAQRQFGAARTGSVFAFAPFIGALGAFALDERTPGVLLLLGGLLMVGGVVVHRLEDHGHEHEHEHEHEHDHEALEHEHAHTHDDGHHLHRHEPMPTGPHSHRHVHADLHHSHPHVPDAHHTHRH
ncbi:MAG: EamA family transporter [Hydrogenophaga sp.]|uniref:EamA family transporter n=1 Tax=Hydrogenophaga sp. TaxID=1904254 RepID=UPI001D2EF234|nr:EamA family transporter [Hydrogenophaga sp.]MBX3611294.1 EamA family transporter [Hydrogenophaga sp.]